MYGDNTARHVVISALHKASVFHDAHQRVLIGVFTDGFSEIPVTVSILGNKTSMAGRIWNEYWS